MRMKQLSPCPQSPNCVSSQSTDPDHFIEPLAYQTTIEEAKARVLKVIASLPRTQIVEEEPTYLHAECTSLIFRFTDDLEFAFDDIQKLIHVRSASRVGHSDLGANRKRVEAIRQHFNRHQ
ncbi:MAG: DUF1499 domain-containing protein [Nitrospirae bacterium]|nr:DUF1499 domain-containing protein [Nitrospirota bacterium]